MPLDDFLDPAQEQRRLKKAQQRAAVHQSGLIGIGIDVVEQINRSAYDLLDPPNPTTLYAIIEGA